MICILIRLFMQFLAQLAEISHVKEFSYKRIRQIISYHSLCLEWLIPTFFPYK